MAKQFEVVNTQDYTIKRLQDNIAKAVNPLLRAPITYGLLLQGVSLAAGDNLVATGLGRSYISFFVGNMNAAVSIYAKTSPDNTKYLNLNSSVACTVDIWVI